MPSCTVAHGNSLVQNIIYSGMCGHKEWRGLSVNPACAGIWLCMPVFLEMLTSFVSFWINIFKNYETAFLLILFPCDWNNTSECQILSSHYCDCILKSSQQPVVSHHTFWWPVTLECTLQQGNNQFHCSFIYWSLYVLKSVIFKFLCF